ncbi:hypothetical protein EJ05DRAFT_447535 [Pseudovirgaria hyperparasitica]|uniref:Vacuolar calcium ion transporter n=1 Tax=Pseudovirgaria hyperparasitica TaxID=470096 RepID=A0A6A6WM44_9PEZI|nr:uncharacterized protein EJ05DRAFT_447535 [Pseudovirgaria hyperparasitica]KAF2763089.1 hypothetical protein EJ05DRAFT_447535 [Pseudovirgaria hyperparasitica]
MNHRRSRDVPPTGYDGAEPKHDPSVPPHSSNGKPHKSRFLPTFHKGQQTPGIAPDGESGRKGFHPLKFMRICARSSSKMSSAVNVLWPVVPAAIAIYFARPEWHLTIFILNYIAMVPSANLLGFAGQELARKLPKVMGIIIETTLGSLVEIILFLVLIVRSVGDENVQVIRAAILGSLLANLLLCLGLCFIAGGIKRDEQTFHEAISEVGTGLMLVAAMGLIIPSVYANTLVQAEPLFRNEALSISRAIAIMFLVAYGVYLVFQTHTHHGLYDDILEADELKDTDRHRDLAKQKLTFTEALIGIAIAIACVALIAVALIDQIHYLVVDRGISDAFVGLILIPLVEKAAEHLTAVDEAWDNQANFALAHVLGASIQTALLNTPLVIIVGWGLNKGMDLNFEIFDTVVLILAVLVVGNFLRDGKSNYLEGTLCVIVYIIIAICAFYYPNPPEGHTSYTTTEAATLGLQPDPAAEGHH